MFFPTSTGPIWGSTPEAISRQELAREQFQSKLREDMLARMARDQYLQRQLEASQVLGRANIQGTVLGNLMTALGDRGLTSSEIDMADLLNTQNTNAANIWNERLDAKAKTKEEDSKTLGMGGLTKEQARAAAGLELEKEMTDFERGRIRYNAPLIAFEPLPVVPTRRGGGMNNQLIGALLGITSALGTPQADAQFQAVMEMMRRGMAPGGGGAPPFQPGVLPPPPAVPRMGLEVPGSGGATLPRGLGWQGPGPGRLPPPGTGPGTVVEEPPPPPPPSDIPPSNLPPEAIQSEPRLAEPPWMRQRRQEVERGQVPGKRKWWQPQYPVPTNTIPEGSKKYILKDGQLIPIPRGATNVPGKNPVFRYGTDLRIQR